MRKSEAKKRIASLQKAITSSISMQSDDCSAIEQDFLTQYEQKHKKFLSSFDAYCAHYYDYSAGLSYIKGRILSSSPEEHIDALRRAWPKQANALTLEAMEASKYGEDLPGEPGQGLEIKWPGQPAFEAIKMSQKHLLCQLQNGRYQICHLELTPRQAAGLEIKEIDKITDAKLLKHHEEGRLDGLHQRERGAKKALRSALEARKDSGLAERRKLRAEIDRLKADEAKAKAKK